MKLTTGILAAVMMTGGVWAQNPNIINNVQNKMTAVEQKQADDSNAALGLTSASATTPATKPRAGAPASAVKPAPIPSAHPVAATGSTPNNKLERVSVIRHADDIQIEIDSRETVIAKVSKLKSPERLLVELPATVVGTSQNKIPVDSDGVKGVRIAMNAKIPPTTSIVVDLEHALGYELTPGPSDKFVLTLHTQAVAKSTPPPTPAKTSAPQAQTAVAKPVVAPPAKTVMTAKVAVVAPPPAPKVAKVAALAMPSAPKVTAANLASAPKSTKKSAHVVATKIAADEKPTPTAAQSADALKLPKPEEKKPEEKKWAMNGKRDPFFSPVVQQVSGSGCSTGKKCLEIGQINVRGVVKADAGFIAVVTNSLNKAYFLHENDPVFNGYVMRITGDSVVFQETVQDKMGKPVTREVTKRIVTPAV